MVIRYCHRDLICYPYLMDMHFYLKLGNNPLIVTIASFTKDKTIKLQKVDDVEYIVITNKMKCS